ncbi:MAG: hypothetical protein RL213_308 [Bacteroidota bacterium]|jgi:hypothetical protein
MKKTILIVAATVATLAASAQMTSKKGTAILPESGDWSIGVDASGAIEYFGNMLNGGNNGDLSWDFTNGDQVITGKMMKDANTAYRVGLRLGFGSTTTTVGSPATGAMSETKDSYNNIGLSAGLQKYRGKGRLQGIYGAEAAIGLSGAKTEWSYNGTPADGSPLSSKDGSTFSFGVRGFIGVEYFFAPKMSLGGEFGWGLGISSTGASEDTYQNVNAQEGDSGSSFGIDTDRAGGAINLSFYF